MKVLIASIDSDIGLKLYEKYILLNDTVETTSRNGRGTYFLEITNPNKWPKFENKKYDIVYYTIGISDYKNSRAEVMHINAFCAIDFLNYVVPNLVPGGKIVVLTSEWGSIANNNGWSNQTYRMSKAALNMGIATLSKKHQHLYWVLMQPGFTKTKMTKNVVGVDMITTDESASGIMSSSALVTKQFSFIDYKTRQIPF